MKNRAYKWFMTGDFSVKDENEDTFVDVDENGFNGINNEIDI